MIKAGPASAFALKTRSWPPSGGPYSYSASLPPLGGTMQQGLRNGLLHQTPLTRFNRRREDK